MFLKKVTRTDNTLHIYIYFGLEKSGDFKKTVQNGKASVKSKVEVTGMALSLIITDFEYFNLHQMDRGLFQQTPWKTAYEKTMGKGENPANQQFLLYLHVFFVP